jgi:hypothetical protein
MLIISKILLAALLEGTIRHQMMAVVQPDSIILDSDLL